MHSDFKLLMLGAMYENGGNTTHRFLDGHPQMFVYPFESQPGTRLVDDLLSSMYPLKYRWPVFALDATPYADYKAIIDEECKVRARTPKVSKFRHMDFDFDDDERCGIYEQYIQKSGRSTAANMEAFFRATFDAWKDYRRTGKESIYVGYSPIITVDAARIISDLPNAHVLHVVRNPWSAYADTKKRPVPMLLSNYMLGWNTCQHFALLYKKLYPDNVHIVRIEDVMGNPLNAFSELCDSLGIEPSDSMTRPTWNGAELEEVYPWGTLRKVTPEVNLATARELSDDEKAQITTYTWQYLDVFGYTEFLNS